jgi:diguanylate cyclase (GGDEF)-like protein
MLETVANQAAVALENGQLEQSLNELTRLKEELRHQAFHDPLTGLANRVLFVQAVEDRLEGRVSTVESTESLAPAPVSREPLAAESPEAESLAAQSLAAESPEADSLAAASPEADSLAATPSAPPPVSTAPVILFLDLDDFKIVNDMLGHGVGDRLLHAVAERVVGAIRDNDLAARLGGDEFAILLADIPDVSQAVLVADRIATSLQLPFQLGGRELTIGASIGLAVAQPEQGAQDLLRNADVAMYAAKARGKGQLAVWDPEMHAAIIERHELSTELTRAIAAGKLRVAYQPLVALDGRGVIGFEALARWNHPTRGPMQPELFVRLAEESGAIIALGRTVLLEACQQAAAWSHEPGMESAIMSVNLSSHQVRREEFTTEVLGILVETGLDPTHLVLEMTETAMFSDMDATISKLQALRQYGVRIAVDDFGTGYSSLRWLRQFPVDILKLAREFIVDGDAGADDWAFAHAIVVLGRTLGLKIVAEGIETSSQRDRLEALGCDYGQGFLFARAAEASLVPDLVAEINRRVMWTPSDDVPSDGQDEVSGVPGASGMPGVPAVPNVPRVPGGQDMPGASDRLRPPGRTPRQLGSRLPVGP